MKIRKAILKDFQELYDLGSNTPELKVSATEDFMDKNEFKGCIKNKYGVLLLAEENKNVIGFIYANTKDVERTDTIKWACLVYLVVDKKYRSKGIATKLYKECIKELKKRKITNVYGWANPTSGIINFLEKKGFYKGHEYVWMDKKL